MSNPKLRFTEEHITVKSLAAQLAKTTPALLEELSLNKERGVYDEVINENTILGWKTVERAAQRSGFDAVDERQPNVGKTISDKEWEILKNAATVTATFHRNYSQSIQSYMGNTDPEVAAELVSFHEGSANTIEATIAEIELQKKQSKEQTSPEM